MQSFSCVFFWKIVTEVLGLTRFLIYFELIFIDDAKYVLNSFSFSFLCVSNCSSTISWKDCPFSIELPLHVCQKSIIHICVHLILESQLCSIEQLVYFGVARLRTMGQMQLTECFCTAELSESYEKKKMWQRPYVACKT